jgi:glycosyltransferase involved in cell wall biosynthesis
MAKKTDKPQRVLIIQAEMKHYRVPFFVGLHTALRQDGIDLTVAYSNPNTIHALRNDRADLAAPIGRKVEALCFFNHFLYQPLWKEIFRSDLVIIGPELKYVLIPMLLVLSKLRLKTVAFWGLGPNMHPDRSALSEWIKQLFFTQVDWWFAYTASIAEYLRNKGMPADKITNVQNATDTAELRGYIRAASEDEVMREKVRLTHSRDSIVGLYCGLIGSIKAIPLLLDAARLVKSKHPAFHLVMIGDGPDRSWLENEIKDNSWIHYVGFKNHKDSAKYYKMSDMFLLSGTVGLAVVDCFAAGLPLIVTDLKTHPPEISYVVHEQNGLIVSHNAKAFAESIMRILSDASLKQALRQGAQESGNQYTIEAMVENYRTGINKCLEYYGATRYPQAERSSGTWVDN